MNVRVARELLAGLCIGGVSICAGCSSDSGASDGLTPGPGASSTQGAGNSTMNAGSGAGQVPGVGASQSQPGQTGTGTTNATGQDTGSTNAAGGAANAPGTGGDIQLNQVPTVAPDSVVTASGSTVDCNTLQRPPTPLRRLTRFEYNNTVRDLFNTSLTPADDFPPDEVADGYSNNALVLTVSALHAEKYMNAAETLAAEAAANLSELLPCDPAGAGEEACAQQFAESFGRRAYRRPLEADEITALMGVYGASDSFEKGIEVMIRAMLQSPQFLFRVEFTGSETPGAGMVRLTDFETATRLSYLLWSSAPDEALLDAAQNGQLQTPEQVASMARQMLQDPKARPAIAEFYKQWLSIDRLDIATKDETAFPLWSDDMARAMDDELEAVVGQLVWGTDSSLQAAFTKPLGLPTGPLATLYGLPESNTVVELPAEERSGLLTLPGFMAVQAHPDQTSPVLRGKFIRSKLLCTPPPPPPEFANINPPDPTEGGTARERFTAHMSEDSCASCHALMDPLGFALENYDAMGVYRTTDNGQTLDLTGEMISTQDIDGPFDGPKELSEKLAGSAQVRDCVATQWYKFAMGRGQEDGDACSLSPLQQSFAGSGTSLMELIVSTTQTEAFLYRRAVLEVIQ